MRKKEKESILKYISTLSDAELKDETWKKIYDTLGTNVDTMIEQDYSIEDIRERERYENYLSEVSYLYEQECSKRGMDI